jgi:hypothetical protein
MKNILLTSIVGLALVAFMNSAAAFPPSPSIPVTNFSFENPTVAADPGYTAYSQIQAWTFFSAESEFTGLQLISTQYSSPTPANSDGSQDAVFNLSTGDSATLTYTTSGDLSGNGASLGTIQSNTFYTLTVALGNRDGGDPIDYGTPGNITLELLAGSFVDEVLVTPSEMPNDAFKDFSVVLTPAEVQSMSLAGENLGIEIVATNPYDYVAQDNFDNVTLTSPEPSSWALMGVGALVIMGVLNRKRLT